MALKVRQKVFPRLALVHGWLFPGSALTRRSERMLAFVLELAMKESEKVQLSFRGTFRGTFSTVCVFFDL